MRSFLRVPVCLLLSLPLFSLGGCGGDDGGTEPPANRAPTLSLSVLSDVVVFVGGDEILLQATASDPDGDTVTLSWTAGGSVPGSLDTATGSEVVWTAADGPGDAVVTVTASDGTDEISRSATFPLGAAVRAGDLNSGAQWTVAGGPFVLLQDVTLPAGRELLVDPGVEVYLRPLPDDSPIRLSILGKLTAEGISSAAGERIRFQGGRDASFGAPQHRGISLGNADATTLRYVIIQNGQAGLAVSGGGLVVLEDCRFLGNQTGLEVVNFAEVHMSHCRVQNNTGNGVIVSGAELHARGCLIEENTAAGVAVTASQGVPCLVDLKTTWLSQNESVNLQVNNSLGLVTVTADSCNLRIADGGENVALLTCLLVSPDLKVNYWGPGIETANGVLQTFQDMAVCDLDVANWTPGVDFRPLSPYELPLSP